MDLRGKSNVTKRLDYNQIAPNGAKALGGVYGYVVQSGLPAELVELVYLRVSQINNCAYCLDMHTRDLTKKGVPIEKLALVQAWKEGGDLFTETERAALRSEEHNSEIQSLMRISYAVFCLKIKNKVINHQQHTRKTDNTALRTHTA